MRRVNVWSSRVQSVDTNVERKFKLIWSFLTPYKRKSAYFCHSAARRRGLCTNNKDTGKSSTCWLALFTFATNTFPILSVLLTTFFHAPPEKKHFLKFLRFALLIHDYSAVWCSEGEEQGKQFGIYIIEREMQVHQRHHVAESRKNLKNSDNWYTSLLRENEKSIRNTSFRVVPSSSRIFLHIYGTYQLDAHSLFRKNVQLFGLLSRVQHIDLL